MTQDTQYLLLIFLYCYYSPYTLRISVSSVCRILLNFDLGEGGGGGGEGSEGGQDGRGSS